MESGIGVASEIQGRRGNKASWYRLQRIAGLWRHYRSTRKNTTLTPFWRAEYTVLNGAGKPLLFFPVSLNASFTIRSEHVLSGRIFIRTIGLFYYR